MEAPTPPNDDDDIAHRRVVVYVILAYIAACVAFLILADKDIDLRTELGDKLLEIAEIIAAGYCLGQFGAIVMGALGGKNAYTRRRVVTSEVVNSSSPGSGNSGTVVSPPPGSENDPG